MRVVSLGASLPHIGIAHAGGEYYLRHVMALLNAGHDVTVVVPATEENIAALHRAPHGLEAVLVKPHGSAAAFLDWIDRRFRPARSSHALLNGIRADVRATKALAAADLVELQWTHLGGLWQPLRAVTRAGAAAVLVSHDVLTQSMARVRSQPTTLARRRLLRLIRWWTTRRDEARQADTVDLVIAFSEKDQRLLEGLTATPVQVLEPALEPRTARLERDPIAGEVVFVGAFDRHENVDGAIWMLEQVWPHVLEAAPAARLLLVGAAPQERLRDALSRTSGADLTGYVEDLDEFYRTASVVVVPLLTGAGVKFKTVTALIWGVPIVSTSVGVEGIDVASEPWFRAVHDEPEAFARAVVDALADPTAHAAVTARARDAVLRRYGNDRFDASLVDLYSKVVAARGRSIVKS